jgi:inactivated superfamily I helicase
MIKDDEIKGGQLTDLELVKINKILEAYNYLLPKVLKMVMKNKEAFQMVNTSDCLNLADKVTEIMDTIMSNSLDVVDIDDSDIDKLIKGEL